MDTFNIIISIFCGGIGGSLTSHMLSKLGGRLQKMKCEYLEDDILSKVPQKDEHNEVQNNLHCKRFKIKNTTNIDIQEFKVVFQFDPGSLITSCSSKSKEGYDKQKIKPIPTDPNVAEATIKQFNRGDEIEFTITIANVTENAYYISESKCLGFKIKCKDVRKKIAKSKQSNQVLVVQHK